MKGLAPLGHLGAWLSGQAPAAFPPTPPSPNPAPLSSPSPELLRAGDLGTASPRAAGGGAGGLCLWLPPSSTHPILPWDMQAALVGSPSPTQEVQGRRAPCIAPATCPVRRGAELCSMYGAKQTRGVAGGCAAARPSLIGLSAFIPRLGSLKPGSSLRHLQLCTAAVWPSPGSPHGHRHPCRGDGPL